jgi:hypothetical protein
LNSTIVRITHSDHLALLLNSPGSFIFGVDLPHRPANLNRTSPFYSVSAMLFSSLGLAVTSGLYVYRSADRQLVPADPSEVGRLLRSPLSDLSLDIASPYFGGFVFGDNSSEQAFETAVLMDVAETAPSDFALGILPQSVVEAAALRFLSGPIFAVFRNRANESVRRRFLLRRDAAHRGSAILEFLEEIAAGKAQFEIVSRESSFEFGISRVGFSRVFESGGFALVLFAGQKGALSRDWAAAKRVRALVGEERLQLFLFDATENDLPENVSVDRLPSFVLLRPGRAPAPLGQPHGFKALFEAVVDAAGARWRIPEFSAKSAEEEVEHEWEAIRDSL